MQLAYIWIEDYINLQGCGILLSGRVRVEETVDQIRRTFSLKVTDNEKYIPHFFGKNISEVTAVVGANGVGKSNLLEYLNTFLQTRAFYEENWLALLYDEKTNSFHVIDALFQRARVRPPKRSIRNSWEININNQSSYRFQKTERAGAQTHYNLGNPYVSGKIASGLKGAVLFYSPFLDFRNFSEIASYTTLSDISTNYLVEHDADDQYSQTDKIEIHKYKNVERQFTFVQDNIEFVMEVRLPTEVIVRFAKVVSNDEIRQDDQGFKTRDFYKKLRDSASSKWNQVPNHLMHEGKTKGSKRLFEEGKRIKVKWWFAINFLTNYLHNYSYIVDLSDKAFPVSSKLEEFDFEKEDPVTLVKKFLTLHTYIRKEKFDAVAFIDFVCGVIDNEADVTSIDEDNESWFMVNPGTARKILSMHRDYLQCFSERRGRRGFLQLDWRNISSGEKAFLDLFSRINWALRLKKLKPGSLVYLLLDEGEAGFHPLWQRKYFSYLLKFLSTFHDLKFHIIMTTHSPFIVSDLPFENLVLLALDMKGNCKVESSFHTIEESFAANIHDLLADAFFMKDGPIGEFATNYINSVFQMSATQPRLPVVILQKLIDTVGEPLIKIKLKEKFSELLEPLQETERIEKQISELTKRLNSIKRKRK